MSLTVALGPHKNPRIDPLSNAQRLQWILEFIRRDLDGMTADDLKVISDDLVHAAAPWWVNGCADTVQWYRGEDPCAQGMTLAQVRGLQEEIREGIHTLLGESVPLVETMTMLSRGQKPPRAWALPASASYLIRGRFDRTGRFVRIICVDEPTDVRMAIVEGVGILVIEFGHRLRTCDVCGAPFLRQYRQEYCNVRCSNKVRNKRRLDRKTYQRKHAKLGVTGVADAASLTTA